MFQKIKIIIALMTTLMSSTQAFSGQPLSLTERLDSLVTARYGFPAARKEPGAAIVVMKGDSVIYERYTGVESTLTGKPVNAATTFNIASISKQFTVVGLLQQVDKGLVGLDAPLSTYFDYPQSFWKKVTPRHLAAQSSGIPDSRDRSNRIAAIYADDASSLKYFPDIKELKFEPGTAYDYVNPTFLLLARIIEKTSGREFKDYQKRNIFLPAGMLSTYYFDPSDEPAGQSHGYVKEDGGWQEKDYGEETFFATSADGGIYSTALDMAAWYRALRNHRLLPRKWLDLAFTPQTKVSGSSWCSYQRRPHTWYGLGWFIEERPGMPFKIYHTGDNGGFQALAEMYPDDDITVIVLENRNDLDRRLFDLQIEQLLLEEGLLHRTNGMTLHG